ncbi:hypothetical protein BDW02DRAFT_615406 [Decorospora gaudefroyi]|uniref:Uncharacterized protein n=1 Tax=Decorospora gaudefroyi TaxID=184978 RepID=A0A6A5JVP2_9PLEO|nr:hypothetical protein BDW02DRAFT_615406 [Decorospora gaudefroyi]
MAPHPISQRAIQRRAEITFQGYYTIIIIVIVGVTGIFCAVVLYKVCSKQRKRERAMRAVQQERTPFIGNQYTPPAGNNLQQLNVPQQNMPQQNPPTYVYNGPLELQGSGRPEPMTVQQLDGYTAAPAFDANRPIEMPVNAVLSGGDARPGPPKP